MRRLFILAGMLLLAAGTAVAQDYPTTETAPAFMYIRYSPGGGSQDFNCFGGGGTFAYNLNSWFGVAADMGGCKLTGLADGLSGKSFAYVFGPRLTLRNHSRFTPFFELNFGGAYLSLTDNIECDDVHREGVPCGENASANAFALTAGGGFDYKLTRKISLRPVQAEYLYTRFGNNFLNNASQNNFRLKSGIVINWGGGSDLF
jgi:opacity protein-like surface antigen